MTNYELHHEIADALGLDDGRTVRALVEEMDVEQTDDDRFVVESASGRRYTVDTRRGECSCPDHQRRNSRCKHLRKCELLTGTVAVPRSIEDLADVARDLVDEDADLDEFAIRLDDSGVAGSPRVAGEGTTTAAPTPTTTASESAAATDGGRPDDKDDDEELCGSTNTSSGEPCGWTKAECPHDHHREDDDEADTDAAQEADTETETDDAEAVAVTDGAGDVSETVTQVIDAATDEEGSVVVIVVQ